MDAAKHPKANAELVRADRPFVSDIPKIRKSVAARGLTGLANNTKWNELITAMRIAQDQPGEQWSPSFRYRCVDSDWISMLFGLVAMSTGRGHWGAWTAAELIGGFLALAVGLGGGLAWLLSVDQGHRARALLRTPALTLVGRRSYAMYLWHMPLIEVASRLALDPVSQARPGFPNWPYLLIYVPVQAGLVLLVAEVSFRLVENPLLALKKRIPYP